MVFGVVLYSVVRTVKIALTLVARVSLKRRMEIWTKLTCHGFHGEVMESLEKEFFERKQCSRDLS